MYNIRMQRINVFLEIKHIAFLKDLPGTLSEHVRRAIDDYTDSLKVQKSSGSQSKKVGDSNG